MVASALAIFSRIAILFAPFLPERNRYDREPIIKNISIGVGEI